MATPMTQDHPKCDEDSVYLGNSDLSGYMRIGWKTKRRLGPGDARMTNGAAYPFAEAHGVGPVFVDKAELEKAGFVETDGVWSKQ